MADQHFINDSVENDPLNWNMTPSVHAISKKTVLDNFMIFDGKSQAPHKRHLHKKSNSVLTGQLKV